MASVISAWQTVARRGHSSKAVSSSSSASLSRSGTGPTGTPKISRGDTSTKDNEEIQAAEHQKPTTSLPGPSGPSKGERINNQPSKASLHNCIRKQNALLPY